MGFFTSVFGDTPLVQAVDPRSYTGAPAGFGAGSPPQTPTFGGYQTGPPSGFGAASGYNRPPTTPTTSPAAQPVQQMHPTGGRPNAGTGGPASGDVTNATNDTLANLQAMRDFFEQQKAAAIGAAGRGAGAQYSAAIARINQQIAQAQQGLGNIGTLFDRKTKGVNAYWDVSINRLGTSADEALDKVNTINTGSQLAVDKAYTSAQQNVLSTLDKIGGFDEATKSVAIAGINVLEDEIQALDSVRGEGATKVLQAAENLSVALAESSKATTNLEFVRQRISIETDIKDQINQLMQQRAETIAAQRAAVGAARRAEAARWGDNSIMDEIGFSAFTAEQYLRGQTVNMQEADRQRIFQLMTQVYQQNLPVADVRRLMQSPVSYFMSKGYDQSEAVTATQQLFNGFTPALRNQAARLLPNALQVIDQAATTYRIDFAQGDPWSYAPNSNARAMSIYAQMLNKGMSEDEALFAARDPVNHTTMIPSYASYLGYGGGRTTTVPDRLEPVKTASNYRNIL